MSKDGSPDSNGRHASPPTKIDKLRYAGYSAEFLDRGVEPNGNIPDRCGPGELFLLYAGYSAYFLDRGVEPNRNIPDRCEPGELFLLYAGYSANLLDRGIKPNSNIPDRCGPGELFLRCMPATQQSSRTGAWSPMETFRIDVGPVSYFCAIYRVLSRVTGQGRRAQQKHSG
jgi:hypothetical protein